MESLNRSRHGLSFLELLVVVTIMGILVAIAVPRYAEHGRRSRVNTCEVNRRNIETQAQMWFRNKGTWPTSDLSDIGSDTNYLPEGLTTCPVDGSSYTFNSATQMIDGHAH